jgi:hypothetical protein
VTDDELNTAVEKATAEIGSILRRFAETIRVESRREAVRHIVEVATGVGVEFRGEGRMTVDATVVRGTPRSDYEKPRARWGASRAAILAACREIRPKGATWDDFRSAALAQGDDVAMSSIRSMALEMEKAGELRRENGHWFLRRVRLHDDEEHEEKGAAEPQPFAGDPADSTSQDAAEADPVAAG